MKIALTIAVIILGLGNLACTTTPGSRKDAQDLAVRIGAYRKEQSARVEHFNQSYRERFNELMDELVNLSDRQLQQGRDQDAQTLADTLISDGKATLIGAFRKSFGDALKNQRQTISTADDAITAARAAYAKAYGAATLDLAKLDQMSKDLEILATKENSDELLKNASGIIQNVVETRQKLEEQAAVDSGKKSKAN
jgi:hypothetical protein